MYLVNDSQLIFPDWNVRQVTLAAAIRMCESFGIHLHLADADHVEFGVFFERDGQPVIAVNCELDPEMFLWVLLHEIFHAYWHHPDMSEFSSAMDSKLDAAANAFAAVAMLPRSMIAGMTREEVLYRYNVPWSLVQIRYDLAKNEEI